jgi:hypothetical protein
VLDIAHVPAKRSEAILWHNTFPPLKGEGIGSLRLPYLKTNADPKDRLWRDRAGEESFAAINTTTPTLILPLSGGGNTMTSPLSFP